MVLETLYNMLLAIGYLIALICTSVIGAWIALWLIGQVWRF